ncbi:unnamed protein product [Paramecium pentaurelia]|uniref:Pru domain-containing protein n=1 Tax=Paramecium pentaurelia TaxID=43138 RepID=A0A8S1RUH5_9CILI|nr:unnamed protein product [Paramecium pentaurelia]
MNQEVNIPCGRYEFNQETRKVVMQKDKGLLNLILNDENELWLKWYNLDQNRRLDFERVIFKGTTIFEKVKGQHRVYLLKITDEDSKYFFWMQNEDVNQDQMYIDQFKVIVDSQIIDNLIEFEAQIPLNQQQPEFVANQNRQFENQQRQPLININQLQLLELFQQQLYRHTKQDLSLSDILSSEFLFSVIQDQDYFEALKEYLPIDQQNIQYFKDNLISPQFQQALDQLCLALKGRERSSVLQQLELDNSILEKEYDGVIAFIQAIIKLIKEENKNI